MKLTSRRSFLKQGATVYALSSLLATALPASVQDDEFSLKAVHLLQDMTADQYKSLWGNLKGITEKEADWQPNPESNSIRWVVGHLCWFEEYINATYPSVGPSVSGSIYSGNLQPGFPYH